jgi:hypothetical protein
VPVEEPGSVVRIESFFFRLSHGSPFRLIVTAPPQAP